MFTVLMPNEELISNNLKAPTTKEYTKNNILDVDALKYFSILKRIVRSNKSQMVDLQNLFLLN